MASFTFSGSGSSEQNAEDFPFASGIKIVRDEVKGRCLENQIARRAGEVLFTEQAIVWSSFKEDTNGKHVHKDLLVRAFGKKNYNRIDALHEELSCLSKVGSLDNARNFLQLVAIYFLQSELASGTDTQFITSLSLLGQLTAANVRECVDDVRCFRHAYPNVLPKSLTDEQAGQMLAVLLTNQLELESYGGSGLFSGTAIMEHSCDFNCSYATHGNQLFMTATRDIAAGERLSIDYGNYYYTPTQERQQGLLESYGFVCSCRLCLGPDRKRAFWCQQCYSQQREGLFCPDPDGVGRCYTCGAAQESSHLQSCLEREAQLLENQPQTIPEIESAGKEGFLHPSHFALFTSLSDLALSQSDEARRKCGQVDSALWPQLFAEPLYALQGCNQLMDQVLPSVHHEKCVFLDRLGQIAVCAGNHELAKNAYTSAYQMSCLANGEQTPETVALHKLATSTPLNMAELLEHYSSEEAMEEGAMEEEEDDEWEDI